MTRSRARFVLFDYGNTLVPYGRTEAETVDRALAAAAAPRLPGFDAATLRPLVRRVKEECIRGAVATGVEITNADFVRALARAAGAEGVPPGLEEELERAAGDAFTAVLRLPPAVLPVLDGLAGRWTLGLLSNYYLPAPLHRTLEAFGIRRRLAAAVVSAEVGRAKPHPEAFGALLGALGAGARECIFVGDNLHADVSGAAALGMATVHTREWLADALSHDAGEAPDGVRPDRVIDRLSDLPAALESLEAR